MRSSLPPSIGGGTAASIAICSGDGDSRVVAESTEIAICEEKRRVSTCVRADASNTAPPQKHDWSSSLDSRLGEPSCLDSRSHRHRSQHAFPVTLFAGARLAATSTAQVYGQSNTVAMATKTRSERMVSAALGKLDALLNSTRF